MSKTKKVDVDAPPSAATLIAHWHAQLVQITDAVADTRDDLSAMDANVTERVWKEAAEPMIRELRKLRPPNDKAGG